MEIGMNEVLMQRKSVMNVLKDAPQTETTTPDQPTTQTTENNMTRMINFRSLYDAPQEPTTETTENNSQTQLEQKKSDSI